MKKQTKYILWLLLVGFAVSLILALVLSIVFGCKYLPSDMFPQDGHHADNTNPFKFLAFGFTYIMHYSGPYHDMARAAAVFMYILLPVFGGLLFAMMGILSYLHMNAKNPSLSVQPINAKMMDRFAAVNADESQNIEEIKAQLKELQPYLIELHKQIKQLNLAVFNSVKGKQPAVAVQSDMPLEEHENMEQFGDGSSLSVQRHDVPEAQREKVILPSPDVPKESKHHTAKERLGFDYMQPSINPDNYIRPNHNNEKRNSRESLESEEKLISEMMYKDQIIKKINPNQDKVLLTKVNNDDHAMNVVEGHNHDEEINHEHEFVDQSSSDLSDLMLPKDYSENDNLRYDVGDIIQYEGQEWNILEINKTYVSNVRMYNLRIKNCLNGYIKEIMLQNISKM